MQVYENLATFKYRNFSHVNGNWASHIYFRVRLSNKFGLFAKSLTDEFSLLLCNATGNDEFKSSKLRPCDPDNLDFHVSLSRIFTLKHHQIYPFISKMNSILKECLYIKRKLSYWIDPSYIVLFNDLKTAMFQCVTLSDLSLEIERFITVYIDEVMKSFLLPSFYENPIPHISILYVPLGSLSPESMTAIDTLASELKYSKCNEVKRSDVAESSSNIAAGVKRKATLWSCGGDSDDDEVDNSSDNICVMFEALECKIGNKLFVYNSEKGFVENIVNN